LNKKSANQQSANQQISNQQISKSANQQINIINNNFFIYYIFIYIVYRINEI